MSLVVITLQDDADGTSLGFTSEPVMVDENDEMSDAQILGMIAVNAIMAALAESKDETSSIKE